MARVVGASEAAISREVIWNSLLPFFFAALKIALPRAISAAIIGEFLVGNEGLGYLIESSRQNFDTTGVFTGIVVATALVLVINAALVRIDRQLSASGAPVGSANGGLKAASVSAVIPVLACTGEGRCHTDPSPLLAPAPADGWIPRTSRGMTAEAVSSQSRSAGLSHEAASRGRHRLRSASGDAGRRRRCCPISTSIGAISWPTATSTSCSFTLVELSAEARRCRARPDWRHSFGIARRRPRLIRRQALDPFGVRYAICNPLHGAVALFNDDMAAALCSAVNDWMAKELLDREPRLRASILVPAHEPGAGRARDRARRRDRRFVQVLLLAMGEMPLGRRALLADLRRRREARAGDRHPRRQHLPRTRRPTSGWPSLPAWRTTSRNRRRSRSQLLSLVAEGVFQKFPTLKAGADRVGLHLAADACCGAPAKTWRGVRAEVPWIDRSPAEIVREHVRFTLQPVDAPTRRSGSRWRARWSTSAPTGMLLFSTDYPHWQFDGEDVLPDGLPGTQCASCSIDNPLETYPRLREAPRAAVVQPGKSETRSAMNIAGSPGDRGPAARRSSIATFIPSIARRPSCTLSCRRAGASTWPRSATHFRHGLHRPAALSAHDGGGHARWTRFPRTGRPAPISS